MARRITGLDLGAYSVKLVRLEMGNKAHEYRVIDSVEKILPFDEKDEKPLVKRQKEAIDALSKDGLLEAETFATGLPSYYGQMETVAVPFTDARKIEAVLPGMLEAEVPFELSNMIVAWHKQESPSKQKDTHVEQKINVAFGKKEAIGNILQLLQSNNVDPRIMNLSSASPYELIRELSLKPFKDNSQKESSSLDERDLYAIVDLGHRATNVCIFDDSGLVSARTILQGQKILTDSIAKGLGVEFKEATQLKHKYADFDNESEQDEGKKIQKIIRPHYQELAKEITRYLLSLSTKGVGKVRAMAFIGGGANAKGLNDYMQPMFKEVGCNIIPLYNNVFNRRIELQQKLAYSYALSCFHLHAKDSRFNFRKDEFVWRGELDFLKTKSTPLILWTVAFICLLVVLWSTKSMILKKDLSLYEEKIKDTCSNILQKKNVKARKCLALMKEQIQSEVDLGIPKYTPSDVYLDVSRAIPKDLNIVVYELDITNDKMRITAQAQNFEDVDKVVNAINKGPCFKNVVKGRAQKVDDAVRFTLSNDINCSEENSKKGTT